VTSDNHEIDSYLKWIHLLTNDRTLYMFMKKVTKDLTKYLVNKGLIKKPTNIN